MWGWSPLLVWVQGFAWLLVAGQEHTRVTGFSMKLKAPIGGSFGFWTRDLLGKSLKSVWVWFSHILDHTKKLFFLAKVLYLGEIAETSLATSGRTALTVLPGCLSLKNELTHSLKLFCVFRFSSKCIFCTASAKFVLKENRGAALCILFYPIVFSFSPNFLYMWKVCISTDILISPMRCFWG